MNHPIQPLEKDDYGVLRFKENKIVTYLLSKGVYVNIDMNLISAMDFSNEDKQQFAQLIGVSLKGYKELRSFVDEEAYQAVLPMKLKITFFCPECSDGMTTGNYCSNCGRSLK